jgi:hypothetical protein
MLSIMGRTSSHSSGNTQRNGTVATLTCSSHSFVVKKKLMKNATKLGRKPPEFNLFHFQTEFVLFWMSFWCFREQVTWLLVTELDHNKHFMFFLP